MSGIFLCADFDQFRVAACERMQLNGTWNARNLLFPLAWRSHSMEFTFDTCPRLSEHMLRRFTSALQNCWKISQSVKLKKKIKRKLLGKKDGPDRRVWCVCYDTEEQAFLKRTPVKLQLCNAESRFLLLEPAAFISSFHQASSSSSLHPLQLLLLFDSIRDFSNVSIPVKMSHLFFA